MAHNTKKYTNSGPGWYDVALQLEAYQKKWGRHAEFKMVGQVSGKRATGRLVVSLWTTRKAHTPFMGAELRYEAETYNWSQGTLPALCIRLLTLLDSALEEETPVPEQLPLFRP